MLKCEMFTLKKKIFQNSSTLTLILLLKSVVEADDDDDDLSVIFLDDSVSVSFDFVSTLFSVNESTVGAVTFYLFFLN